MLIENENSEAQIMQLCNEPYLYSAPLFSLSGAEYLTILKALGNSRLFLS